MENKKGTATNRDGLGSTYTGTQTPDPQAPDGYQAPPSNDEKQQDKQQEQIKLPGQEPLGSEYEEDDSYGDKPPTFPPEKKDKDDQETAEGTPIR